MLQMRGLSFMAEGGIFVHYCCSKIISWLLPGFIVTITYQSKGTLIPHPNDSSSISCNKTVPGLWGLKREGQLRPFLKKRVSSF